MYELRQEAVLAVRITLRQSLTLDSLGDKIDFMQGAYLRELWKYHEPARTDSTNQGFPSLEDWSSTR